MCVNKELRWRSASESEAKVWGIQSGSSLAVERSTGTDMACLHVHYLEILISCFNNSTSTSSRGCIVPFPDAWPCLVALSRSRHLSTLPSHIRSYLPPSSAISICAFVLQYRALLTMLQLVRYFHWKPSRNISRSVVAEHWEPFAYDQASTEEGLIPSL